MARFDVYKKHDEGLVLDCQANILRGLNTRFVVPLMPPESAPRPAGRLNPAFEIDGQRYVMVTQYAGAIPASELGNVVGRLLDQDTMIVNALDMLISGF